MLLLITSSVNTIGSGVLYEDNDVFDALIIEVFDSRSGVAVMVDKGEQ